MKKNQRFIAGASCPNCLSTDALMVDEKQTIECVDCGFTQTAQQRDSEAKKEEAPLAIKKAPQKVNVSDIIRITNLKD